MRPPIRQCDLVSCLNLTEIEILQQVFGDDIHAARPGILDAEADKDWIVDVAVISLAVGFPADAGDVEHFRVVFGQVVAAFPQHGARVLGEPRAPTEPIGLGGDGMHRKGGSLLEQNHVRLIAAVPVKEGLVVKDVHDKGV